MTNRKACKIIDCISVEKYIGTSSQIRYYYNWDLPDVITTD